MSDVDYYELLGVPADADRDTLKKAYRSLLKQVHPDTGGNAGMFRMVQDAYAVLSDEARRASYDRGRSAAPTGPAPTAGTTRATTSSSRPYEQRPAKPGSSLDNGSTSAAATSWASALVSGPQVSERVTPGASGRLRRLSQAASLVAAVLGALLVVTVGRDGWDLVGAATCAVAVVATAGLLIPGRWFAHAPLVGVGGLAASYVLAYSAGIPTGPGWWLWVAPATIAGVTAVMLRLFADENLDVVIPVDRITEFVAFGSPGSGVPGTTPQVQVAARVGADTTMNLTAIPGTRILHRVRASELDTFGVDQAVVCGRKVALVVSTAAPAGSYSWSPTTDSLLLDGAHITGGNVLAAADRGAFATVLSKCEVRTFAILHSTTGPVFCDNSRAPAGALAGGPQDVLEHIGTWFLTDHDATVDRRVVAALAERML